MISKTDIQTVLDALETAASYHIGYSKRREAAIAILTAALARVDKPLEPSEAIEPNNDEVICPNCCTQFRAIPVNVQKLLMEAGIEPPFTHPAIKLDDDRIADLENSFEIERLKAEKAFYKNRVELLHKWQSKMRDPERTLVCDILANGQIWHDKSRYTPQTSKPEPDWLLVSTTSLAMSLWRSHFKDEAPDWKPLPDLAGVISQIDNMVCGLVKPSKPKAPLLRTFLDEAKKAGITHLSLKMGKPSPLTDDEILNHADPFGAFQYGDAQGDKRLAFARAVEQAVWEKMK